MSSSQPPMRTVVITGATGGIGIHTAIGVARTGARVIVTGRNADRGDAAVERIRAESGNEQVELVLGDLSEQARLHALADEILAKAPRIDVLINNAGLLSEDRSETVDGVEGHFAVNVIAPYLLTQRLMPALEAAVPARVVYVTGGSKSGPIDPADLQSQQGFSTWSAYNTTKRAMETMVLAQAGEMESRGVFLNVVYPGPASTPMTARMTSRSMPWYLRPLWPVFSAFMQRDDDGKSAEKASRSSVWAASAPESVAASGQYFDTHCQPARFHASLHEPAHQAAVIRAIEGVLV